MPSPLRIAMFAVFSCVLLAQDPFPPENPTPTAPNAAAARPGFPMPAADPQPYEKVITKDAKSKKGLFTVHQIKDKYYYEIPKAELGKQYLWVSQIARTTAGVGYGGQMLGNHVVRWEQVGNKINLRQVTYEVVADPKQPIAQAVDAAKNNTIFITFPVAAFAKNGDIVVEVSRLFTSDIFELSARQRLNATMMDPTRSYVERITPYPENVEAEVTQTYTRMPTPVGALNTPQPVNPFGGVGMRPGSATIVLHHSMVRLPEKPMMPRVFDERVGYFIVGQLDFGRDEQRAPFRRYITRWRLEKKDPDAAVSEPVKPIVYYIDPATPTKYVPWMKRGVESWNVAFEAAGFKNAILAKDAPSKEEDPDWSPEDVRYSVIRWLPSTIENASGPHISDPRTGEILNADIQFYHNVMNLVRDWYFLQVGPLDPRAQKLPLPDDLMGHLLMNVCAHEVGHTLGFQHNMKASSTYPQEKVHNRDWVIKMGHAPSIMDYARFNYVAQPEDNIPVETLVPGIGPYDIWATKWGYAPIPGAKTADAEKHTLDTWAREQDTTPWFRFSTPGAGGADPGDQTEAVGDADAVKSTALGLKNLRRVEKLLIPATTTKVGEPYEELAEMYGRMLGQWTLEMNHVATVIGGFDTQQKAIGQEGVIFTPISKARQVQAVQFLSDNAFATPTWVIDQQILRRIEPVGAINRVNNAQRSVMTNLLNSARFARLNEQEALDASNAYTTAEFLAAVRKGIWKELGAPRVRIDAFRRNLQGSYLELANNKLNGSSLTLNVAGLPANFPRAFFASSPDEKPMYRAELRALSASITSALARTQDRPTRAHLEGARDQIARILDPKFAPSSGAALGGLRIFGEAADPFTTPPDQLGTCWPDYMIRP